MMDFLLERAFRGVEAAPVVQKIREQAEVEKNPSLTIFEDSVKLGAQSLGEIGVVCLQDFADMEEFPDSRTL